MSGKGADDVTEFVVELVDEGGTELVVEMVEEAPTRPKPRLPKPPRKKLPKLPKNPRRKKGEGATSSGSLPAAPSDPFSVPNDPQTVAARVSPTPSGAFAPVVGPAASGTFAAVIPQSTQSPMPTIPPAPTTPPTPTLPPTQTPVSDPFSVTEDPGESTSPEHRAPEIEEWSLEALQDEPTTSKKQVAEALDVQESVMDELLIEELLVAEQSADDAGFEVEWEEHEDALEVLDDMLDELVDMAEESSVNGAEDVSFDEGSDNFDDSEEDDEEDDEDDGLPELSPEESANFRKIFETQLHSMPVDQRVAMAKTASGPHLSAFCFDPHHLVIGAVLENTHAGLPHARLIANHHVNAAGLRLLAEHASFLRDLQVRRFLCRNNQTPELILRKILRTLTLIQIYKQNKSHNNTDRAKKMARLLLREKFQSSGGEQKAALIFSTEGRCLPMLVGLSFDGKTTSLLCRRTYNSSILIQNLLRFPATPPQLIKHLSRQQAVKRAAHLKKLLLQHANCPSDLKRAGRR